jgi:hypothetical protein
VSNDDDLASFGGGDIAGTFASGGLVGWIDVEWPWGIHSRPGSSRRAQPTRRSVHQAINQ